MRNYRVKTYTNGSEIDSFIIDGEKNAIHAVKEWVAAAPLARNAHIWPEGCGYGCFCLRGKEAEISTEHLADVLENMFRKFWTPEEFYAEEKVNRPPYYVSPINM